ncbi:MAG: undecaprenyl-diphosphate phosphatase [Promethearchaeota archaeon]|nr:MAG: undecaprenyl-diphosphate phosphatase [Candidatus Lokiarchaeota archaeon]
MIEFIIIAIIQGVLEWLPISSSGQVMIVSINVFGISPANAYSLAIWLHLGTSLSVLLKFRTDFIEMVKSIFSQSSEINDLPIIKRNWLIIATIGTAVTGIPIYLLFKLFLEDFYAAVHGDIITLIISSFLILTGIILLLRRKVSGKKEIVELNKKSVRKDSFIAGMAQGFTVLPGISRSGITISTVLMEQYTQENALTLSFLISVPAAFGSIFVDLIFGQWSILGTLDLLTIIVVTLISFIVGYATIDFFLKLARKIEFGYFCIAYGIISYLIIIPFLFLTHI